MKHLLALFTVFAALTTALPTSARADERVGGTVVDFVDCIGGKIALGAGFASYHCYTRTEGRGGYNRHYVKFYSLGLSASWARHKPSFHCVMKGQFTDFKQRHFFGGGQLGVAPLVGYKGAAFYNTKTGSYCYMYGMAVGYEADLSGGLLTIIDSGEAYL